MKLIQTKFLLFYCLLIIISACGQNPNKDLLLGNWTFYKFEFKGQLADIPESKARKANEINRELVISFQPSNKYSSKQKGGADINNSTGTYLILPNDRLVIMSDTVKIIQLDDTYLKLYRNELTPVIIFKRQNG